MKRCCRNQATQLIFLVIFIPAMLLPIALPMAGALAGYENWTFDEAFEFVIRHEAITPNKYNHVGRFISIFKLRRSER